MPRRRPNLGRTDSRKFSDAAKRLGLSQPDVSRSLEARHTEFLSKRLFAVLNRLVIAPLHYGVGSERIVDLLLKAGASPKARSATGNTPLHSATARPDAFIEAQSRSQ